LVAAEAGGVPACTPFNMPAACYTLGFHFAAHASLQDGKVKDQLEGADAAALTTKVAALAAAAAAPAAAQPQAPVDVTTRIKQLLSSAPVVLFMKGNAAAPYCGFSRRVVDALRSVGVGSFKDVDIFQDEELR
jgi:hypothetical protein